MGKKKKVQKKTKEYLVLNRDFNQYKMFDIRGNRPIGFKEKSLDPNAGSMLVQEVDTVEFSKQPERNPNSFDYFAPNNIGMLLSIMQKSLDKAREIYLEKLNPDKYNHSEEFKTIQSDKAKKLYDNSLILYDYIEQTQTAIVFGYTALEAFTNLSIPIDYVYTSDKNNKGIKEVFDKEAIERWLTLKVKISNVLTDIYKTEGLTKLPIWSKFLKYEKMRHDIIHQKSVLETDFYKQYLEKGIFDICSVPTLIIQHFYDNLEKQNKTNPIWPWIIGRENSLPISTEFDSSNFEIIGNLYEGRKK